jgi:hypothetical protein
MNDLAALTALMNEAGLPGGDGQSPQSYLQWLLPPPTIPKYGGIAGGNAGARSGSNLLGTSNLMGGSNALGSL